MSESNPIPEQVEAAIEEIKSRLSEEHQVPAQIALVRSWNLGGLQIEERTNGYRYLASWKLASDMWLATVYVATAAVHAICPQYSSQVADTSYA